MGGENVLQLPTRGSDIRSDRDETCDMNHGPNEAELPGHVPNGEIVGQSMDITELEEGQLLFEMKNAGNIIGDASYLPERVGCIERSETELLDCGATRAEAGCDTSTEVEEGQFILETNNVEDAVIENANFTETVGNQGETVNELRGQCVDVPSENGCLSENETHNSCTKIDGGSMSGVKRMRTSFDEQRPSVHVKYHGLPRQGKRKLEELLREWSEWMAHNCSGLIDKIEEPQYGEKTYFPALDFGLGKSSAVSFWVEDEVKKPLDKDFTLMEDDSVPLYDRGFALGMISADGSSNLEGGLELLEAPRCFNCGSYSHSLKECPKPRDNVAVNNSRKQLKSKRNQIASMRNVARYYQDSPGGKYEGLKPGVLEAETRRLLGLGEFDPPPWIHRMREIGYPPGYLEPEDENLPSGITIYAEEEIKLEGEEGEILEAEIVEPQKKKSVKFPGINAPIPRKADEKLWAPKPSNSDRHRNGEGGRPNNFSESNSRGRYQDHNNQNFKDEDALGLGSRYSPRYGDHDVGYTFCSSRDNATRPRSPSSGRSLGDRSRADPSDSEGYRLYSSFSYSFTRRFSEHSNGSDVSRGDHPDYSSRSRHRDDRYRQRGGR